MCTVSSHIEVRTLGRVSIWVENRQINLPSRKQTALLIYLAVHQGREFRRDELACILWQGAPLANARRSLSQAVYAIRKTIPGIQLETSAEYVRLLEGAVAVDIHKLDDWITNPAVERFEEVFLGDFLENFWVSGAPEFEQWQQRQSTKYRRAISHALHDLLDSADRGGDWSNVKRITDWLKSFDPYNADVYRLRIQAIAALEGRASAIAEYRQVEEYYQTVLNHDVDEDLVRLCASLQNIDIEACHAAEDPLDIDHYWSAFIGRQVQFGELRSLWDEVKAGLGRAVVIYGEAGIGKTRFCKQFLRLAAVQGARIFNGKCYPADKQVPYSGLAECLLSNIHQKDVKSLPPVWSEVIAEVLPECIPPSISRFRSSKLEGEGARRRLFEGFAQLLHRVSQDCEVVLFLDDFHWADDSTATAVQYLVRRLHTSRVLILLSVRPEELIANSPTNPLVHKDQSDRLIHRIEIPKFSIDEGRRLVASFEERQKLFFSEKLREEVLIKSGGRPFFIIEMLKVVHSARLNDRDLNDLNAIADESNRLFSTSIESFLTGRINSLGVEAEQVLASLAVLGKQAAPTLVQSVSGLGAPEFMRGVRELHHKGMIEDEISGIRFAHDLIREAMYRSITNSRRQSFHGIAAAVLCTMPDTPPGVIAAHYDLAGMAELAYKYAMVAAETSASVYAHEESEYFLRLAAKNASSYEQHRVAKMELATLLFAMRRFSEAHEQIQQLRQDQGNTSIDVPNIDIETMHLAITLKKGDAPRDALLDELHHLLAIAEESKCPNRVINLLRLLSDVAHDIGRKDIILQVVRKLADLRPSPGGESAAVEALALAANALGLYIDVFEGVKYAEMAVALSESLGDEISRIRAILARANNRLQAGMLELAERDFGLALELIKQTGAVALEPVTLNSYGVLQLERGDYDGAEVMFREAIRHAFDAEALDEQIVFQGNLLLLKYETGQRAEATELARTVIALSHRTPVWWCTIGAWSILGLYALESRQFKEANQCGIEVQRLIEDRNFRVSDVSYPEIFLARLLEVEGDVDSALKRLDQLIAVFEKRDVFCRSRLELERARFMLTVDRDEAWRQATEVKVRGQRIGAKPLVAKADNILERI